MGVGNAATQWPEPTPSMVIYAIVHVVILAMCQNLARGTLE